MRAEEAKMPEPEIPVWDSETSTVCWKGRAYPFVTFCMIHAGIIFLLNVLEVAPRKSREEKYNFSTFLFERCLGLNQYLQSLLEVGIWCEFNEARLALFKYWWEEDEASRLLAIKGLVKVYKLLYLDQLFEKKPQTEEQKSPGALFQEVAQAEAVETAEALR